MKTLVAALLMTLSMGFAIGSPGPDQDSFNISPDYTVSIDKMPSIPAPVTNDPTEEQVQLMEERLRNDESIRDSISKKHVLPYGKVPHDIR